MDTQADFKSDTQHRLLTLRQLIRGGEASTQDDLCRALRNKKFDVTQSTVSRDLRRIGAVKAVNNEGKIIYRLPEDHQAPMPMVNQELGGLITEIQTNESLVVIHTTPGSASLVARFIDAQKMALNVLGTIAGDDTIFVVPSSVKKIAAIVRKIKEDMR